MCEPRPRWPRPRWRRPTPGSRRPLVQRKLPAPPIRLQLALAVLTQILTTARHQRVLHAPARQLVLLGSGMGTSRAEVRRSAQRPATPMVLQARRPRLGGRVRRRELLLLLQQCRKSRRHCHWWMRWTRQPCRLTSLLPLTPRRLQRLHREPQHHWQQPMARRNVAEAEQMALLMRGAVKLEPATEVVEASVVEAPAFAARRSAMERLLVILLRRHRETTASR